MGWNAASIMQTFSLHNFVEVPLCIRPEHSMQGAGTAVPTRSTGTPHLGCTQRGEGEGRNKYDKSTRYGQRFVTEYTQPYVWPPVWQRALSMGLGSAMGCSYHRDTL